MKKETRYTVEATQPNAYYGSYGAVTLEATYEGGKFTFHVDDGDDNMSFVVTREELVALIKATEPEQVFSPTARSGHIEPISNEQAAEWLRAHRGETVLIEIRRKNGQIEERTFEVYSINPKNDEVYAYQREHSHFEKFSLDAVQEMTATGVKFDHRADITL